MYTAPDFGYRQMITVRDGKGGKDRITLLPNSAIESLKTQLAARNVPGVEMPQSWGLVPGLPSGLLISDQCGECFRLHDDFTGRLWPDVPLPVISYHSDSLPLFTPAAHRYSLPAFFRVALSRELAAGHILLDMVIYDLCPEDAEWWQKRFGVFTPFQRRAAAGWLEFILSHEIDFCPDMRAGRSGYERYWQLNLNG